jgi:hypothetical protein
MNFSKIEYPCLVGMDVGICKVMNEKSLTNWLHGFESDDIAFLKHGFNTKLRAKFIITYNGLFQEFHPQTECRKWSKLLSWLFDLSKLKCNVEHTKHFSAAELRNYVKRNITSLDKHFSQAMRLYKFLKTYEQTQPLSVAQLQEIIQKV